jgi:hypothetical protein
MRRVLGALIIGALVATAAYADEGKFSREVKLTKGKAKVQFTAMQADGTAAGLAKQPKLGIAPSMSPSFSSFLAKRMDENGRVVVVPPTKLNSGSAFSMGFDQLMRSELVESVGSSCKAAKLDYLLLLGSPQMSQKTDATAYVFGLGRMRMRNTVEARLYECRTTKSVWRQSVLLETSQGMMSMAFGGSGAGFGGPEAEQAMANIFADKLTVDMKW